MSEMIKIQPTPLEAYVIKEANSYANDGELIERFIVSSQAYRFCLIDAYREFVKLGKITAFDNLSPEHQKELFDDSLKLQPEVVPAYTRIHICICIWLLYFVFENYFA